ncbi:MAG: indole-3-glycerol phosphate synthase TrpC [Pedosphaera sp.]|nr:indole-3-glycerol phosphate synthase TrpC [Pedosphaera sp.]
MSLLAEIVAHKRTELARLPKSQPDLGELRTAISKGGPRRNFLNALRQAPGGMGLIAEVKKASPSAGVIRSDFDPVEIARQYETAGATCLSVLTDEKFFQGSLDYLKQIRAAVNLPLLRKDFIIDERQILEAIEWGADAILLIAAILDDDRLRSLHELATAAGLTVLTEVHNERELDIALGIGAPLIGVNNRDLATFKVDLAVCERLAARMDLTRTLLVAESGIHNRRDVERLVLCGAKAILVGESLMRAPDIGAMVCRLLGR